MCAEIKLSLDHSEQFSQILFSYKWRKPVISKTQQTSSLTVYYFIWSFLQPKDNNTQHKSKISHVIFIHHHELSPTLVPRGHGTAVQFSMSDSMGSSSPPAQVQMCWIASVNIWEGGTCIDTLKNNWYLTDYKGILMEKAIFQACDTSPPGSSSYTQSPWLTEENLLLNED